VIDRAEHKVENYLDLGAGRNLAAVDRASEDGTR
jgi:hypothetical protein